MHPASSVIAFTTLSGAGYGLLFSLIFGQLTGLYESNDTIGIVGLVVAFFMVVSGLLMSTFHLGHPERAWRAFSQWRSSWLSREGVCAVTTFIPWTLYAGSLYILEDAETLTLWSGIITAVMAMVTVYTTSMIYRSIKAVQSWYNVYVSPLYLMFSLSTGLTILNAILYLNQAPSPQINNLALLTLISAILLKRGYWRFVDKAPRRSTMESATGLGKFGKVKALEHPHSHVNYLMQEMGYQIARKHSNKLRRLFQVSWLISVVMLSLTLVFMGTVALFMAVIGCLLMALGIVVERWLFFAEAKHDQALYYGG